MLGSVIIPAYNEDKTLPRLLRALDGSRFEIIVVCNGCCDDTANIARSFAGVEVLEQPEGNKAKALNAGDRRARFFPRFYLDADIVVTADVLTEIAAVLRDSPFEVAAPRIDIRDNEAHWIVRAYYRAWKQLPYVTNTMIGSGFYALSKAGRGRFMTFPDVFADDEFIRRLIPLPKRCSLSHCRFSSYPPRTLRSLVLTRLRHRECVEQLEAVFPETRRPRQLAPYVNLLGTLVKNPSSWGDFVVYSGVWILIFVAAQLRRRRDCKRAWFQDRTTRIS